MALQFEVKKYKAKDELSLKDLQGKTHKIPILITYEEADELVEAAEKKKFTLERFAEILFKEHLEKVKEITGQAFEDCVVSVGFQFTTKLFKNRSEFINSTKSMHEFLKKK